MTNKLKILLVASLALNLFAVGGVVGALVMGARLKPTRTFVAMSNGGPSSALRAPSLLGTADGLAIRAKLREAAEAGSSDREAARAARREAFEIMARQRYDARAVEAAFTRSREHEAAARARIEAALAEGLQAVDAGQRAQLAQQLMRPRLGRRGGPDRDGRAPDAPPPPPQPPLPPPAD